MTDFHLVSAASEVNEGWAKNFARHHHHKSDG